MVIESTLTLPLNFVTLPRNSKNVSMHASKNTLITWKSDRNSEVTQAMKR